MLGVSWGTTLALAYAQTHPKRVAALVLALVTTTSRREVDWITRGVGRIFPREWQRFVDAVPDALQHAPLVDAALRSQPRRPRFDDAGRLHVLDDAGHGGGDTFSAAITGALSELATR